MLLLSHYQKWHPIHLIPFLIWCRFIHLQFFMQPFVIFEKFFDFFLNNIVAYLASMSFEASKTYSPKSTKRVGNVWSKQSLLYLCIRMFHSWVLVEQFFESRSDFVNANYLASAKFEILTVRAKCWVFLVLIQIFFSQNLDVWIYDF